MIHVLVEKSNMYYILMWVNHHTHNNAHELQEHYPDLVIGEKDGSELQRVNYTGLIAILINEIKRMKRELSELENDVVLGR